MFCGGRLEWFEQDSDVKMIDLDKLQCNREMGQ